MADYSPFDTLHENPFETPVYDAQGRDQFECDDPTCGHAAMETETIEIAGRTFEVERLERTIILKGRRGATYVLVPFVNDRTRLHVVAWGGQAPFPGVVLIDTPNGLEVIA
jgi:hypothetical protein